MVEGCHYGHAVFIDPDGNIVQAWGDPLTIMYPRSSNKPVQATSMVRSGLELPANLMALAAASHSGESMHLEGAKEILAHVGLTPEALQTPPDFPLDPVERDVWIRDGRAASPIGMNCSGKHAAMLATCVVNEWDIATYRDVDHPLQVAIRDELMARADEPIAHLGVDGCGAPVMAISLTGLARSLSSLVQSPVDDPGRQVVDAMRSHPQMVGGSRREVTALMAAVPGLVAKDGAEGVYVGALADGSAFAVKIVDGSERARTVAMAEILGAMGRGEEVESWRTLPVLGHGRPVGEIRFPRAK